MDQRPPFLWDVPVTERELRERLHHPDPAIRAQWEGRVLCEATFAEVWQYLTLEEVLRDWPHFHSTSGGGAPSGSGCSRAGGTMASSPPEGTRRVSLRP